MAVDGWTPSRLGDLIAIKHGWPFKSENFHLLLTGRPIVVSVGNFRYAGGFRFAETPVKEYRGSYPREYELKAGNILLIMTCQTAGGEILGVPAKVPDDGRRYLHNQRLGKVVVRDGGSVVPEFLYWLFLSQAFNRELVTSASGTKILHTAPARIEAFHFDLPPTSEQRAIARILDNLDSKIEVNRRMSETLESMARSLFKSWFVDFDPVRTKSEDRDPGLPKTLADLFPARLVDSELGEIPEGWGVIPIGDLAEVVGGSTPSTTNAEYWAGGEHCWATPKDLSALNTPVLIDTERRITDAGLSQIGSGLLPAGTVLLSSRAPIGYLAISEMPVAINQGFIAMKPKKPVSKVFLLLWARVAHDDILSRANGSTFLEISKSNFRPLLVVRPSDQVLAAFNSIAEPLYGSMVINERRNRSLAALRDSLLPKLIAGDLRVPASAKSPEHKTRHRT